MSKAMWAMIIVPLPSGTFMNTNISISETPVTMSGMVMGMLETVESRLNQPRFMEYMPIAPSVPMITEAMVAITATVSVTFSASMMV